MSTATVEVEVEHRLVVICWMTTDTIHTFIAHGGIRRYQLNNIDSRLLLGGAPMPPYFYSPSLAYDWMANHQGREPIQSVQLEWRAYEEMMRLCGEVSFGYVDYFDRALVRKAFPRALDPFDHQPQVSHMRATGQDPTDLDLSRRESVFAKQQRKRR